MKIPAINCCFFYIFYIHEIVICYFLAVCVIRVMKETPTYSVNPSTPARNLTEAAVTGRYCPHIGLKKCTYTLIDNIDAKELNTL